jgi:predicted dehydrogenase
MDRRVFMKSAVAAGISVQSASGVMRSPNERVSVCVMGLRGRGGNLLDTFAALPDVDVTYLCDVDAGVLGSRADRLLQKTGRRAKQIKDYREALDDPMVDALVIGTPDHWHALPTIHAAQAGKDIYVEKPDAHNILEGRTMVAAASKYERVVQLGTQGRSGGLQRSAMEYIAAGHLGKVRFAKAWESSRQGNIGYPPDSDPPSGVDYDTWLGPAPKRPFNIRRFHGSWRWFFDYGTGDLGNDGVHLLDLARWGLETAIAAEGNEPAGLPRTVSALGGKYYFDDAQDWPDTLIASYDYAGYVLTYELRIWTPYQMHGESEGAAIYGDNGYVTVGHDRWRTFDAKGKQVSEQTGEANNVGHAQNFIDCMRTRQRPVADLETVGHPSSLLCHLGNAAWRAGRSLQFDSQEYTFVGDEDANRYLTRPEYRKPWVLPSISEL